MKKTVYEVPEALVVCLDAVDVITTSPQFTDENMIKDGWMLDEN